MPDAKRGPVLGEKLVKLNAKIYAILKLGGKKDKKV
jgi:hypothetical protein